MLHLIYSIHYELLYYAENVFIMYWMGVSCVLDGCFCEKVQKYVGQGYKSITSAYLYTCQLCIGCD